MIPQFDYVHDCLPAHTGDPTDPHGVSPYDCTLLEVVERFGFTSHRQTIIKGLIGLRRELLGLGVEGFQWVNGSFCELKEWRLGEDPGDVDVVTFLTLPIDSSELNRLLMTRMDLWSDPAVTKASFGVDHYIIPLPGRDPRGIVSLSSYWHGLFSHRRDDFRKGMLQIELNSSMDDADAYHALGGA